MSRIRANKITDKIGTGAIELEKGAHLPIGMGITGAGGLNITGVVTATSFSGSGAALTGIDATSVKDSAGNVKIQAQASGAVYTGIHTFGTNTNFTDIDVDGHTNLDNVNVAGVATFASAVNTGALTASTGTFSGNVSVGGTLTYEDVTNIDSVGIITARSGVDVDDFISVGSNIHLGNAGVVTATSFSGPATQVTLANESSDTTCFPVFATAASGNLAPKTNESKLTFNSSTGQLNATKFVGDGSALTGVTAGITTEALVKTNGQTASLDLSKDDHKVTATGTVTIDVSGGSESTAHTLRIVNSGITTIGFSTYFLFPSGGQPSLPTASGAISLISFTIHRAGAVGISTQLISGASINFS